MKAFKTFFSFAFPLIAILLSYSIFIIVDKGVANYQQTIANDYSIVVVSTKQLNKQRFEDNSIDLKELEELPRTSIVRKLEDSLSKRSLDLLNAKLPYFYKVHLNNFPTDSQLVILQTKMKNIEEIKQTEVFAKDHNKTYSLLLLVENIVLILLSVIIVFGLLILIKQVKIWFYEHHERISIMRLHGASIVYCAKPLIKTAFYASIITSAVVLGSTFFLLSSLEQYLPQSLIQSSFTKVDFDIAFYQIFVVSLIISIGTVISVLIKHRFNG